MEVSHILRELKEIQLLVEKYENFGELPEIEIGLIISKMQFVYNELQHTFYPKPFTHGEAYKKPLIKDDSKDVEQIGNLTESSTKDLIQSSPETVDEERLIDNVPGEKLNVDADPALIDNLIQIEDNDTEKKELEPKISDAPQLKEKPHQGETQTGKEILAEKFGKDQTYINEMLAQGRQKKDLSSLMQSKPIKDIEAAIGVNEKYLIIRELFNGDNETYLKTIHILNNSANFNEAFNYIHSTFNWNLEGIAAQKLLDIVRRRFIIEKE